MFVKKYYYLHLKSGSSSVLQLVNMKWKGSIERKREELNDQMSELIRLSCFPKSLYNNIWRVCCEGLSEWSHWHGLKNCLKLSQLGLHTYRVESLSRWVQPGPIRKGLKLLFSPFALVVRRCCRGLGFFCTNFGRWKPHSWIPKHSKIRDNGHPTGWQSNVTTDYYLKSFWIIRTCNLNS